MRSEAVSLRQRVAELLTDLPLVGRIDFVGVQSGLGGELLLGVPIKLELVVLSDAHFGAE